MRMIHSTVILEKTPSHASYTLEGTNLENVESIKYLGVTITSDLRWNTHVSNVCTKANRTLGFLRRNLYSCPQEVKEAAYKGLVRPVLDYGSSVWDPQGVVLQEEFKLPNSCIPSVPVVNDHCRK